MLSPPALPASRRAPYWGIVVLSLCLLIAAQVVTPAQAQDAGDIQKLSGILRPDEGIYYQVNGLQRGQTLYVYADNTSGNLDPFLAVLAGETDVDLLRKQFAESVAALLAAGDGPIVAADTTAEALSLAWNDDLDVSHAAGLAFQAPADGDYLLLLRSSAGPADLWRLPATDWPGYARSVDGQGDTDRRHTGRHGR